MLQGLSRPQNNEPRHEQGDREHQGIAPLPGPQRPQHHEHGDDATAPRGHHGAPGLRARDGPHEGLDHAPAVQRQTGEQVEQSEHPVGQHEQLQQRPPGARSGGRREGQRDLPQQRHRHVGERSHQGHERRGQGAGVHGAERRVPAHEREHDPGHGPSRRPAGHRVGELVHEHAQRQPHREPESEHQVQPPQPGVQPPQHGPVHGHGQRRDHEPRTVQNQLHPRDAAQPHPAGARPCGAAGNGSGLAGGLGARGRGHGAHGRARAPVRAGRGHVEPAGTGTVQ